MHREFWALRNVDFTVARGESVGIIGRNGSGKSTLLQLVAGILPPTEGRVCVNGRIAALLELGAGFNAEFTGRENVRVNAALLGMTPEETDDAMPRILDFAEIGDHVEQKVKTYSSGMFVRLAFSVAVHSTPDLLIVDEALAVGDAYFQAKSQRRISELRERGSTLLLVTHSTDALSKMCDRGIVLDAGRQLYDGDVRTATATYLRTVFGARGVSASIISEPTVPTPHAPSKGEELGEPVDAFELRPGYVAGEVRIGNGLIEVVDFRFAGHASEPPVFNAFERVELEIRYRAHLPVQRVVLGMQLHDSTGILVYSTNSMFLGNDLLEVVCPGLHIARFRFDAALLPGIYHLSVGVSRYDAHGIEIEALDRRMGSIAITVVGQVGRAVGMADLDGGFEVVAGFVAGGIA